MEHTLWVAVWVADSGEPSSHTFVSKHKDEEQARVELVALLKKEWDWGDDDEDEPKRTVEQEFDMWDMYGLYLFKVEDEVDKDGNDYKVTVTPSKQGN